MPALEILPVCADYLQPFELPTPSRKPAHIAVYFPGSTIGNMEPDVARQFSAGALLDFAETAADSSLASISKRSRKVLEAAYNDSAGVTAEFNLNMLVRANRELGADFDLSQWRHRAIYNETRTASRCT